MGSMISNEDKTHPHASGIDVHCAHDDIVKIDSLKEHPENPNKHPDSQIELLAKIIKEQGWRNPIVVSTRSGMITKGHARLYAARKLGLDSVPIDRQWYMSEEREMSDMLADNRIAELSDLAIPEVKDLIAELEKAGADLDLTGYDAEAIETLKNAFTEPFPEISESDDQASSRKIEPKSKLGDLYILGNHRLMCGDATNSEHVGKLMNGIRSKMIFTDPPWNVKYGSTKNDLLDRDRIMIGDDQTPAQWKQFCQAMIQNIRDFNEGDIYLWSAPGPEGMRLRLWLIEAGCHWSATIIWAKDQLVLSPANYQRHYEMAFYGWFNKSSYNGDTKQTELWSLKRSKDSSLHPTMKPVELCMKGMLNSSHKGDVVLDPFGGAGSTLIACEKIERDCYMMEIDPGYIDVTIERWEKLTGGKAELVNGAK